MNHWLSKLRDRGVVGWTMLADGEKSASLTILRSRPGELLHAPSS